MKISVIEFIAIVLFSINIAFSIADKNASAGMGWICALCWVIVSITNKQEGIK